MGRKTYFVQECPTCGRNLHVRVEYLGKRVVCEHCSALLDACDPDSGLAFPQNSGIGLIRRAEELIAAAGDAVPNRPR